MMDFFPPTFANAPMDLESKKPSHSTPIYSGEAHGSFTLAPGAALSLPNTSSSSVVLGEALPENYKLHHHVVVLPELSLNFSSPLAGSRRRRHPRAVGVLNAETPNVRCLDRITASTTPSTAFILTLSLCDLQRYEDAIPLSLLVSPS